LTWSTTRSFVFPFCWVWKFPFPSVPLGLISGACCTCVQLPASLHTQLQCTPQNKPDRRSYFHHLHHVVALSPNNVFFIRSLPQETMME
jgi:hypothetical protein